MISNRKIEQTHISSSLNFTQESPVLEGPDLKLCEFGLVVMIAYQYVVCKCQ